MSTDLSLILLKLDSFSMRMDLNNLHRIKISEIKQMIYDYFLEKEKEIIEMRGYIELKERVLKERNKHEI